MGDEGILLATANGDRLIIQPSPISVVDVTGAGDAFWAGMLTALLHNFSPVEAAQLGQVVAEFKIGVLGHIVEFPSLESLWTKTKNIRVSTLKKL